MGTPFDVYNSAVTTFFRHFPRSYTNIFGVYRLLDWEMRMRLGAEPGRNILE